jgi:hypothetical protein
MDTGSIARIPAANAPSIASAVPVTADEVETELPPTIAVRQIAETEAVRFEPSGGAGTRAAIEAAAQDLRQQVIIDPETRDIVFQAVDERTGEVVRQVPDEMLLRLRAYVREISVKQTAEAHAAKAETIA